MRAQTVLKLCGLRSCMKTFCVDRISQEEWMQFQEYAARGSSYELIEIETSLLPHPFYIRRHTSDFKNLHQIFVSEEYQFLNNSLSSMLDLGGYIGLASLYAISKCKLQFMCFFAVTILSVGILDVPMSFFSDDMSERMMWK